MRLISQILASALIVLSAAAIAQFQFYGSQSPFGGQAGPTFRTLAQGQQSSATEFRTEVLNNDADLQRWWSRTAQSRPETAPRGVEWGKEMVVAINLGMRRTLGYSVYVETISKSRGQLLVSVVELKPAPGTMQAQALSSPWVLIRMDRQVSPLVFQRREITQRSVIRAAPCGCTCGCPYCARGHEHGGN